MLAGGNSAHGVAGVRVVEAVLGVEELEGAGDCWEAGDVNCEVGEEVGEG